MAPATTSGVAVGPGGIPKKKPISYSNLVLGAALNMFEYVPSKQSFKQSKGLTMSSQGHYARSTIRSVEGNASW